jgi:hypothetical protein
VSDCDGALEWFRHASQLSLIGSKYFPPAFAAGDVRLILGDGGLPGVETNSVTIDAAGKVTAVAGDSPNLKLGLNPKTGQFSGSFGQPAVKFSGAVLQIQDAGFGFFLGANGTGYALFEPVTP